MLANEVGRLRVNLQDLEEMVVKELKIDPAQQGPTLLDSPTQDPGNRNRLRERSLDEVQEQILRVLNVPHRQVTPDVQVELIKALPIRVR